MLKLPGTADEFLARHWQKRPLFIPQALDRLRPAVTRNELAWLATLDDVESRLVFTDRTGEQVRYRAETGPFDIDYLAALPRQDWTLLVHDVEKHLPVMRKLFAHMPFIPEWRIDDVMVSFAAKGGGVGPHTDNYDVFLCQGIGVREWHVTQDEIAPDRKASKDLALAREFDGDVYTAREGDVLYLPPGAAHWGTANRACLTYSIGMRAPQLSDLAAELPDQTQADPFYRDPDLTTCEAQGGRLSDQAIERAMRLLGAQAGARQELAERLGRFATATKEWITPETVTAEEALAALSLARTGKRLKVHGMARIAWDADNVFVNGWQRPANESEIRNVAAIYHNRATSFALARSKSAQCLLLWMLEKGAFEIPGKL